MTPWRPELGDLVEGLTAEEEARLRRVHDLLLRVGPPPDLDTSHMRARATGGRLVRLLPRRRLAGIAVAGVLALAAFGGGYALGDRGPHVFRQIEMTGPDGATATIALLDADDAGNWPMELVAAGLDPDERYEMWLTRKGALADSCGSFRVGPDGSTTVPLNAPFRLRTYDGWVVVRAGSRAPVLTT